MSRYRSSLYEFNTNSEFSGETFQGSYGPPVFLPEPPPAMPPPAMADYGPPLLDYQPPQAFYAPPLQEMYQPFAPVAEPVPVNLPMPSFEGPPQAVFPAPPPEPFGLEVIVEPPPQDAYHNPEEFFFGGF